jgi:hypothetical protein
MVQAEEVVKSIEGQVLLFDASRSFLMILLTVA